MRKLKSVALLLTLSIVVGSVGATGTVLTVHAADYIDELESADSTISNFCR